MAVNDRDPREVVEEIEQAVKDGYVVTCSECGAELPSDERCEVSEDGEHSPDQELHDDDGKSVRAIEVSFTLRVPNDGYDYMTDVTGRLEHLLTLMMLHPLVRGASTAGASPTGSGYVRDTTWIGSGFVVDPEWEANS